MATEKWKKENQDKMRAYRRKWYANNKERAKKRTKERKVEIKEWWFKFKSNLECSSSGCNENHPAVLEFHHKNDDKEATISQAINDGWSKERILKEVGKCDVYCANCHRKKHWDKSKKRLVFRKN